jgi:GH15 family glucan-1,4-alpha-glucosidase
MLLEDYALIGDTHTAALVGRNGSIDWLCLPRFDSQACFAALLGESQHGHWAIGPAEHPHSTHRQYKHDSLVLQTDVETDGGAVRVVDCMPVRQLHPTVIRLVEGLQGDIRMRMRLILRFDYGSIVPWVQWHAGGLHAISGPEAVFLSTPIPMNGKHFSTEADFTVHAGERIPFVLMWHHSNEPIPPVPDAERAITDTTEWWERWTSHCRHVGRWREPVIRSLITLKALTYAPTGGIIAAPTTSLPERLGGVRNWDYRYCWIRDATYTPNPTEDKRGLVSKAPLQSSAGTTRGDVYFSDVSNLSHLLRGVNASAARDSVR